MVLKPNHDPMGVAINDYFKNGKADHLWVYSDIAERDKIPVKYLFRNFKGMPAIEQKALQRCTGRVLDVGAAAGSHSLWLSKNKLEVVSLDISELSVKTMKERGVVNPVCGDFFKFTSEQKFDTLLFLMNGVGIAGSLQGLEKLFKKCHELLNKGGKILLDSSDINYMFDEETEKPENKYYGQVTYVMRYGDIVSDNFEWLFIDFDTLKTEVDKYGFHCEKIMDGPHYEYLAELCIQT